MLKPQLARSLSWMCLTHPGGDMFGTRSCGYTDTRACRYTGRGAGGILYQVAR